MNTGRAPTVFDAAVLALAVIAAVAWAIALNPNFIGLTVAFAILLILMLFAIAWMLKLISDRLSSRYEAMSEMILRSRKDFVPTGRREGSLYGVRGILDDLRSAFLFFLAFLFYFLVMMVFFEGLGGGGQPLSDTNRLIAAFLGTSALHFSGHAKTGPPKVVLEFLVPFGIIVGLIDFAVIGPNALIRPASGTCR
jgi:hypothetical protein